MSDPRKDAVWVANRLSELAWSHADRVVACYHEQKYRNLFEKED